MYKSILVPIDITQPTSWEQGLPVAIQLCQTFGAKLHLLTVIERIRPEVAAALPDDFHEGFVGTAKEKLVEIAKELVPTALTPEVSAVVGTAYQEIIAAIGKFDVDLVVMASHRPELMDYLIGPNAARVVRHAPCSVMVVRQ
jgi:nucleotide-binding universal stress UspA family protein